MERTDIKEALERVYKESYPGFVCPFISECGKDMHEYGYRFSKAKLGSD